MNLDGERLFPLKKLRAPTCVLQIAGSMVAQVVGNDK